jgi:hypothetical protein
MSDSRLYHVPSSMPNIGAHAGDLLVCVDGRVLLVRDVLDAASVEAVTDLLHPLDPSLVPWVPVPPAVPPRLRVVQ